MSQKFGYIEPIKSDEYNNNDISDDNILKDMIGSINDKRKISYNKNKNNNNISDNNNNKNNNKNKNNNNINDNINNKNKNNYIEKKDHLDNKKSDSQRNSHLIPNIMLDKMKNNKKIESQNISPHHEKEKQDKNKDNDKNITNTKKIGGKGTFKPNILNILEKKNDILKSTSKNYETFQTENNHNTFNNNKNNSNLETNNNSKYKNNKIDNLKEKERLNIFKSERLKKNKNNILEFEDNPITNENFHINPTSKLFQENLLSIENTENNNNMKHINTPSFLISTNKELFEPKELEENNNYSFNKLSVRTNRSNSVFIPNINSYNKLNENDKINPLLYLGNNKNKNKRNEKNNNKLTIEDLEDKNSSNDKSNSDNSIYEKNNSERETKKENESNKLKNKIEENFNNKINRIFTLQENTFRHGINKHEKNKSSKSPNSTLLINKKQNEEKIIIKDEYNNLKKDNDKNNKTVRANRNSKNLKIIEKIKKEKNIGEEEGENKRRNSYNILSNRSDLNENIVSQDNNNIKSHIKKSKSKPFFIHNNYNSPKNKLSDNKIENKNSIKPSSNIKSSNKYNKKKSNSLLSKNIKNTNQKFINKHQNIYQENNNINEINNTDETYHLLRERFLEYLKRSFGENIPKHTKDEEKENEKLLRNLCKNEVPIENENLENINCSNDMKAFLLESINNFKLLQMKEKMKKNDNEIINNQKFEPSKSTLLDLIHLDYENENKEYSNILEPMELGESYFNINFRKTFVDSIKGYNNNTLPSDERKQNLKQSNLFK